MDESMEILKKQELERYSRQIIIPEVGIEGQEMLKNSSVLIIGAGGLGTPLGLYLAAAGIGKIGIVDYDTVSYSNLQRQVLYSENDVGKSKAKITGEKLSEINTDIEIETYDVKLSSENAMGILKEYDVIADGSDNFATKYLLNDACVLLNKPFVYGSILRFDGQVIVFDSSKGPCYRCLFPEPPQQGEVPTCAEAGVVGVLPGIIGSIQANEVIKLLLGKGEPLIGRLLMLDALKMKFSEVKVSKDAHCPVCGKNPSITHLIDYENFCKHRDMKINNPNEISVKDLKIKMENGDKFELIDVREPYENLISNIGGKLIPINSIPSRINELNKEEEIIIYCRTGHRSENVVKYMRNQGFTNVKNLIGGIYAWSDEIDSSVKKY